MKFKKTEEKVYTLSQKLVALANGMILKEQYSNNYFRIKDDVVEFFEYEWKQCVSLKCHFDDSLYKEVNWYNNIPKQGILCIDKTEKIYLVTRKCEGIYSDEVEIDHSGCIIEINRLRPLTKEEVLEICYDKQ